MKIIFSEAPADYAHYIFPYAVWATPEPGEAPADLFNAGFLPSSRGLDQFGLSRNVRVDLSKFKPSSENRRILRKGEAIAMRLVPRAEYDFSPARREFCGKYAAVRFGPGVMPPARLELVFNSPVATHLLVFNDAQTGAELGVVVLYLEAPRVAFYRYSFYDLDYVNRSLGLFMMTSAAVYFAKENFAHLYLGTCYSERALYKTQFPGVEYFNGFKWSADLEELKFQLRLGGEKAGHHLLEDQAYLDQFYGGDLKKISGASPFRCQLPGAQLPPV